MTAKAKLVALIVTLAAAYPFAADWPQYYGPKRDSTSPEKGLLRAWPKEGPRILWTAPLGAGFGGPAVSRGKVYLLDRDEKVGDTLRVYDFRAVVVLPAVNCPRGQSLRTADLPESRHRSTAGTRGGGGRL